MDGTVLAVLLGYVAESANLLHDIFTCLHLVQLFRVLANVISLCREEEVAGH